MGNIVVFGGAGFVGSHIVKQLVNKGHNIKIITLDPESANHLKVCGKLGQITIVEGDITIKDQLGRYIENCDTIINAIGILHEKSQNFHVIHTKAVENLAEIAKKKNITQLIHISSLGIDKAKHSRYARSKLNGEKSLKHAFPNAIILQPSVIFGKEDRFFNLFAKLVSMSMFIPLLNKGTTKLQPVYVADIAKLVCKLVGSAEYNGKTYEVAGSKVYTLREILNFIMQHTGYKRRLVPLSYRLSLFLSAILELTPVVMILKLFVGDFIPITTRDSVKMLLVDNISESDTLNEFGITPSTIEDIVPQYISIYNKLDQ